MIGIILVYTHFYSNSTVNHTTQNSTVCGVIINIRQQRIGQDKFIYIITVDDSTARIQIILYSEIFFKYKNMIEENNILFFHGKGMISINFVIFTRT